MADKLVILVVEDDAEMNQLLRELLSVHGMDSVPAYSGSEAVELAQRPDISAVLLDVMLPVMDGFETCLEIRRAVSRPLPVLMVTAMDSPDCRCRGYDAGADGYFVKPFDPDEVVQALRDQIV